MRSFFPPTTIQYNTIQYNTSYQLVGTVDSAGIRMKMDASVNHLTVCAKTVISVVGEEIKPGNAEAT